MAVLSLLIWQPSFAELECDTYRESTGRYTVTINKCIDNKTKVVCYLSLKPHRSISCVKLD